MFSECPGAFCFTLRCETPDDTTGDGRNVDCFGLLLSVNPPKPIPRDFSFDPL